VSELVTWQTVVRSATALAGLDAAITIRPLVMAIKPAEASTAVTRLFVLERAMGSGGSLT